MRKCGYRKIALIVSCIIISIMITLTIIGIVMGFIEEPHIQYFALVDFITGEELNAIGLDSRLVYFGGSVLFGVASLSLIRKVYQGVTKYLLFDETKVIFVLSRLEQEEFR